MIRVTQARDPAECLVSQRYKQNAGYASCFLQLFTEAVYFSYPYQELVSTLGNGWRLLILSTHKCKLTDCTTC